MYKANILINMDNLRDRNTTLIPNALQVRTPSGTVYLTPSEMCILYTLVKKGDRIFTREDLLDVLHIHPSEKNKRSIDVHISGIRRKLSDIQSDLVIQTRRGLGYAVE